MHVASGVGAVEGDESLTASYGRQGAERVVRSLAEEFGLTESQRRWAVGERASLIASMAAEEAADLIIVGSRTSGLTRRALRSPLALELRTETHIPVLVAPPLSGAASDQADRSVGQVVSG